MANRESTRAESRHLRLVRAGEPTAPAWRAWYDQFAATLVGLHGDQLIAWNEVRREALYRLAAEEYTVPLPLIEQMFEYAPPPSPIAGQWAMQMVQNLAQMSEEVWHDVLHGSATPPWMKVILPLKPLATLKENLAILRFDLNQWPSLLLEDHGDRAITVEGEDIPVADLPPAYHEFPRRIRELDARAILTQNQLKKYWRDNRRYFRNPARYGRPFVSSSPHPVIREYEVMVEEKYRHLRDLRAFCHDLIQAYGYHQRHLPPPRRQQRRREG